MSIPPLLNGPIPPFNNPPIQPYFYQPSRFVVSNITLGYTTIITTSVNQNYVIGQSIRLLVPNGWGTRQLNGQQAYVISIPMTTQVEININSIGYDTFINAGLPNMPQIMAIGDINSGQINSNGLNIQGTYIPGSFIDISPLGTP